jgi:hypothetical protein
MNVLSSYPFQHSHPDRSTREEYEVFAYKYRKLECELIVSKSLLRREQKHHALMPLTMAAISGISGRRVACLIALFRASPYFSNAVGEVKNRRIHRGESLGVSALLLTFLGSTSVKYRAIRST